MTTTIYAAHLFHLSIVIFQHNPHPFWRKFKNSIAAEITLLHTKPFMVNHFHFHIVVELAASQALLHFLC